MMLTPVIEELRSARSPWEVYRNCQDKAEVSFFLDSVQTRVPDQRYSYIGRDPFLEILIPSPRRDEKPWVRVTGEISLKAPASRLFEVLRTIFRSYRTVSRHPFFTGGAVGYFGYETVTLIEPVRLRPKIADAGIPWLYLGFFRELIVYDHALKIYRLIVLRPSGKGGREANLKARFDRLRYFFSVSPKPLAGSFRLKSLRPGVSRSGFESMVRRAKEYIAAGDIYQANLSQRFSFEARGSGLLLYERLRRINPSPFCSYWKIRDLEIVSSSPERLIRKTGRMCVTQPIAGTRPRYRGYRKRNARMRRELLASPKERAEHIMLVDLERNDLGRVCDWKTVRVEEMMKTEKYSHVIHIVSKVTGRMRQDRDAFDLIRAMFPGGTITGCPKIRCMEIIDELEPVRRGIYTGSIGYLDFRGDLDLNIVIRTVVLRKNKGYLQVGAGIVYDSDPGREYEETLHKGRALVEALHSASGLKSAVRDS